MARRKEIYTYEAKDMIFALAFNNKREGPVHQLALGSFVEDYTK